MKKIRLTLYTLIAVLALTWGMIPGFSSAPGTITAQAAAKTSGKCGKNVTWKFNTKTKTLTLSGKGATYDYTIYNNTEFQNLEIKKIVVNKGITKIGTYMFAYLGTIDSVSLPNTLTTVGAEAFHHAGGLGNSKTLPDSITTIESGAFFGTAIAESANFKLPAKLKTLGGGAFGVVYNSTKKLTIKIPDGVTYVGEYAFSGMRGVTLYIPDSVTYLGNQGYIKAIKGNKSTYVKQRAGDMGLSYSGKASGGKQVIFVKNFSWVDNIVGSFNLEASVVKGGGKLTYESSNPKVASVSSKGVVTVKKAGTAKITITAAKTSKYPKTSRTLTLKITNAPKGTEFVYKNIRYTILTSSSKKGTVKVTGMDNDTASVTIPDTLKIGGVTYTIKEIGNDAFSWKEGLKKITIKSKSLTKIGQGAFDEIYATAKFIVPSKKLAVYKKLLSSKTGFKAGMTISA